MKKAKITNKKQYLNNNYTKKEQNIEDYSIKNFIKILSFLVIIFLGFYFVTTIFIDEEYKNENKNQEDVVVDSSKIILGQLLTREEQEYYVIATKPSLYKTSYIQIYNKYINSYKQKENSIKFYYIDLDNALNNEYLSDELNITNEISKLKLNDEVLFKINNGQIEKTYVGKEKILEKLSKL